MGLFDRVKGAKDAEPAKLTKEESFAAIALASVAADGVITEEEAQGLIVGLVRMKLYAGYNGNQMGAILNKLVGIIRKQGTRCNGQHGEGGTPPGYEGDRVRRCHRPSAGRW